MRSSHTSHYVPTRQIRDGSILNTLLLGGKSRERTTRRLLQQIQARTTALLSQLRKVSCHLTLDGEAQPLSDRLEQQDRVELNVAFVGQWGRIGFRSGRSAKSHRSA